MPNIKKILFPVDFSEGCKGAARYVESLAGRFEAEIMLLHVLNVNLYHGAGEHFQAHRQQQLNEFLADELRFLTTRRVCVIGDPAQEIVNAVCSWTPDLVMMPTFGLGCYRPHLLGSVTAKVLHDVRIPVWTFTHSESAPALERITVFRVLCALSLGHRSETVLKWAASLANDYGADLGIVHAAPGSQLIAAAQERIDALQADAGTTAKVYVSGGEPREVVRCASKEFPVDLLVIGRHGGNGDPGHLRHNAYGIIRDSACPVISI